MLKEIYRKVNDGFYDKNAVMKFSEDSIASNTENENSDNSQEGASHLFTQRMIDDLMQELNEPSKLLFSAQHLIEHS